MESAHSVCYAVSVRTTGVNADNIVSDLINRTMRRRRVRRRSRELKVKQVARPAQQNHGGSGEYSNISGCYYLFVVEGNQCLKHTSRSATVPRSITASASTKVTHRQDRKTKREGQRVELPACRSS